MTLAQQIRELMGRATKGPITFDHDWARIPTIHGKRDKALMPIAYLPKSGIPQRWDKTDEQEANARLISLLLNNAETLAQAVEAVEAAKVLATEAVLLLNHAEGCAKNHYGDDHSLFGMPGWLADSRERIMAARKALPTPPTKEDQNDG